MAGQETPPQFVVVKIHRAAKSGDEQAIGFWLEDGRYDVNNCVMDGKTPLHEAASEGNLGVVRMLVAEFNADVNACAGTDQGPPLLVTKHLDVVRVLVSELKADVNACDDGGSTLLHWAALCGDLKIVKQLIQLKANVNACDGDGYTHHCMRQLAMVTWMWSNC